MRTLMFVIIVGSTLFSYTGCTKDRTPVAVEGCTDTVSFSQDIMPLFNDNCISCHDNGNSTGYTLTDHASISGSANQALGAMRQQGFQLMPEGGPALPDSVINIFQCWIQNGKQDN